MTAAAAQDGAKQGFGEAYRALAESGRFQTEFADMPEVEPVEPPSWLVKLIEWLSGTGGAWSVAFWIVAGVLALIILFFIGLWLWRLYHNRSANGPAEEDDAEWRPEAQAARSLLGEADALAKQGRYAEAAHLLLFRSLEDIHSRLPDFLRPALTSRDIAASETLPDGARGAFAAIARVVERGIFAERAVDETGWGEARQAYEQFAFGESWR